jgi:hypothetical protein
MVFSRTNFVPSLFGLRRGVDRSTKELKDAIRSSIHLEQRN